VGIEEVTEEVTALAPSPARLAASRALQVLPYFELSCAILAAALWYTQGGAVWYAGGWPGPWPLLLLGLGWLARIAIVRPVVRIGLLDVLLMLFVATALLGVWAAYDPGPAWAKFWLVIGAVGLYYALKHLPNLGSRYAALAFLGLFGVAVSVYFFVTNDWSTYQVKVPLLYELGRRVSAWLPALAGHAMNTNVVGGMLAFVLPLYVPLLALASQLFTRSRWAVRLCRSAAILAAGVCAFTLLITTSRGALVALAAMILLWLVWRLSGFVLARRLSPTSTTMSTLTSTPSSRIWSIRVALTTACLLAGVSAAVAVAALIASSRIPGAEALANRLAVPEDPLPLARDYFFTGAGLGMFQMHYSIYTLLIHVGYSVHSHNLLLNLLIEQGIFGLLSYAGLVVAMLMQALRRLRHDQGSELWIVEAAIACLGVILLHGLVDDALYGSRALLLLFVPVALVSSEKSEVRSERPASPTLLPVVRRQSSIVNRQSAIVTALALVVVAGAMALGWRTVVGLWDANWGALEQSQVELSHYDQWHFDEPTMDQVRQQQNLDGAIAWFNEALRVDPGNATARQRLAAIALARGQYAGALAHMQAAWDAGQRDSTTRLLLGDALVATGHVAAAVPLVRGLRFAPERLAGQAWSRYWMNKDYRHAAGAWSAVVELNPGHANAAKMQAEAEKLAGVK
jgi:putative inorganic carbon (hco3(-)) transporter